MEGRVRFSLRPLHLWGEFFFSEESESALMTPHWETFETHFLFMFLGEIRGWISFHDSEQGAPCRSLQRIFNHGSIALGTG